MCGAHTLFEIAQRGVTLLHSAFAGFDLTESRFRLGIRQHPPVQRHDLRGLRRRPEGATAGPGTPGRDHAGEILLRLPFRTSLGAGDLLRFLGYRAVAGVEEFNGGTYCRTLRLAHGAGTVALSDGGDYIRCVFKLEDLRDLGSAVQRCRRLLDANPVAVAETLGSDPLLAPIVGRSPGRRVPGSVDGAELAFRAVLGQQVSVAAASRLAGQLVSRCGEPLPESLVEPDGGLTHLFPEPVAVAEIGAADLAIPAARREALWSLALALAGGEVMLDPGSDRDETHWKLLSSRGVGPWTASYVAIRALGDPDAFPSTDLGVRQVVRRLGFAGDPAGAAALAERWRPWRDYATQHLWASLEDVSGDREPTRREVAA